MRAWIRKKPRKGGTSFQVIYRRGGRAFKLEYAGTFAKLKEADARRDTVQGWLAQGLDPVSELAKLQHSAAAVDVRVGSGDVEGEPRRCRRELAQGVHVWVGLLVAGVRRPRSALPDCR